MKPKELKAWRKRNGYSQGQLAKVLGVVSLTISRWELGVREIPSFLHLALECLELKGGELEKGSRYNKPGRYPEQEERIIVADKKSSWASGRATKTKKKRR